MDNVYFENETITANELARIAFSKDSQFVCCTFLQVDLSNLDFDCIKFSECKFIKCNLSNVSVKNSSFREVEFRECKVFGVNFSSCEQLFDWSAMDSLFDYSVFQVIDAPNIKFENCSLREVDFSGSKLTNGSFIGSNLVGASFGRSDLTGCDFTRAENYVIDFHYTKIKKAKFSMPEALGLLDALDISIQY